ncbi:hypothetical protein ACHAWO_000554, partial [Cyclotella atomus]
DQIKHIDYPACEDTKCWYSNEEVNCFGQAFVRDAAPSKQERETKPSPCCAEKKCHAFFVLLEQDRQRYFHDDSVEKLSLVSAASSNRLGSLQIALKKASLDAPAKF